jgi:EPS-associated MarR family transcriptional regulator|tara:strand:- start:625 stop:966 length:342 start_codon:yes stop_codon:yes gene_type:complete
MQKNNNNNFDEEFNLLRLLDKKPNKTQRKIAEELGLSLGKLNYCIKALKKKGLIKIKNFKKNDNKLHYLYLLTPKGIKTKAKLTLNYLIKKSKEYEELKKELIEIKKNYDKKF